VDWLKVQVLSSNPSTAKKKQITIANFKLYINCYIYLATIKHKHKIFQVYTEIVKTMLKNIYCGTVVKTTDQGAEDVAQW
jgi:hypothetical protein